MKKRSSILFNPLFVALPFSLIIILLLPDLFDKYKTKLVYSRFRYNTKAYFNDLDNDGYSEMIYLFYNMNHNPSEKNENSPAIQIDTDCSTIDSQQTIDQFNFSNKWFKKGNLYFFDFDSNGYKEIYFYSYSQDSLFIQGLEPYFYEGIFLEKFLCRLNFYNEEPDLGSANLKLLDIDLNNDGYKDIVGDVMAGFTAEPRFVFTFDIKGKKVLNIKNSPMYITINDTLNVPDNIMFSTSSYAPGNLNDSIADKTEYSDHSAWSVIFDNNLQYYFPPIEIEGMTSGVTTYFNKENDRVYLYSLERPPRGAPYNYLTKYSIEGKLIKSKKIQNTLDRCQIYKKQMNDAMRIFLLERQNNELFQINDELELEKISTLNKSRLVFIDLNNDRNHEVINWESGENDAYLYSDGFSDPATIKTEKLFQGCIFSVCRFKDKSAQLAISNEGNLSYYTYFRNPLFAIKYPAYLFIYLLVSALIYLVLSLQKKSLQQKFEQEKRITELELLTIKNQIDPHFIMNAVNILGSVIFKSEQEKQKSYQFLINLSSMIRDTLQNSKELSVSLKEELDFVENYLQIQQYRFNNSFSLEINNEVTDLPSVEVPKMIIQTFAENAVKHGLAHKKDGKGKLTVDIKKTNGAIRIEISDNGIGRKQAYNVSKRSTGKGLEIIDQIMTLYNRLKDKNVNYKVVDLKENEKPAGTKIIIKIQ